MLQFFHIHVCISICIFSKLLDEFFSNLLLLTKLSKADLKITEGIRSQEKTWHAKVKFLPNLITQCQLWVHVKPTLEPAPANSTRNLFLDSQLVNLTKFEEIPSSGFWNKIKAPQISEKLAAIFALLQCITRWKTSQRETCFEPRFISKLNLSN